MNWHGLLQILELLLDRCSMQYNNGLHTSQSGLLFFSEEKVLITNAWVKKTASCRNSLDLVCVIFETGNPFSYFSPIWISIFNQGMKNERRK